jgi:hypothetical protein
MALLSFDRELMLAERWLPHVARWLDSLPGDGWKGTPTEAAEALAAKAGYGDHRPLNPGPMLELAEPFIRSKGWTLTIGRTGRGRYTRLSQSDKTNSR